MEDSLEGHTHESSTKKIEELVEDIVHEAREIADDVVEIVEILVHRHFYRQPIAVCIRVLPEHQHHQHF